MAEQKILPTETRELINEFLYGKPKPWWRKLQVRVGMILRVW